MGTVFMYLYAVICGGFGIVTSVYLVVSLFGVIGKKIFHAVKDGASLYD